MAPATRSRVGSPRDDHRLVSLLQTKMCAIRGPLACGGLAQLKITLERSKADADRIQRMTADGGRVTSDLGRSSALAGWISTSWSSAYASNLSIASIDRVRSASVGLQRPVISGCE